MDNYCQDVDKRIKDVLKRLNYCDRKTRKAQTVSEFEKYSTCYQFNSDFLQALVESHQKHCERR